MVSSPFDPRYNRFGQCSGCCGPDGELLWSYGMCSACGCFGLSRRSPPGLLDRLRDQIDGGGVEASREKRSADFIRQREGWVTA